MIASCGGCTNRWTGLSVCHCATCHVTFTSLTAFERHRRHGQCIAPGLVGLVPRVRGGTAIAGGFVAWGYPGLASTGGEWAEHHANVRGNPVGRPRRTA